MKKILRCLMVLFLCLNGCASQNIQKPSAEKNVTIHISKEMLKSLDTDNETYISSLSDEDKKKFKKAAANKDGSVTLVMGQKENKAWLKEYTNTIDSEMKEFENSSAYSIQKIEYNKDYTTLKITEDGEEAPAKDALLVMPLAVYGEMYQLMSGIREKDIRIHCIIRSASGIQIDDVTYPDDLPAESEDQSDGSN